VPLQKGCLSYKNLRQETGILKNVLKSGGFYTGTAQRLDEGEQKTIHGISERKTPAVIP
jgi:hypothetical protein